MCFKFFIGAWNKRQAYVVNMRKEKCKFIHTRFDMSNVTGALCSVLSVIWLGEWEMLLSSITKMSWTEESDFLCLNSDSEDVNRLSVPTWSLKRKINEKYKYHRMYFWFKAFFFNWSTNNCTICLNPKLTVH